MASRASSSVMTGRFIFLMRDLISLKPKREVKKRVF